MLSCGASAAVVGRVTMTSCRTVDVVCGGVSVDCGAMLHVVGCCCCTGAVDGRAR